MSDPEVIGDQRALRRGRPRVRELEEPAKLAQEWRRAVDDEAGARELLAEEGDDAGAARDGRRRRASGSRRSTRRSASRWSSRTRTTTRT